MKRFVLLLAVTVVGCGSSKGDDSTGTDAAMDTATATDAPSDSPAPVDASDASMDSGVAVDTLSSNRDRLLGTYFAWLKANPTQTQSNGLSGNGVTDVCDLWKKLQPSAQAVFLTLTHRMQGGKLGSDGSSMLWHVTKLYRLSGGQNATSTDPGSCGGAEYNRMMMAMDTKLHDALVAANAHTGAKQNGVFDIADIPANQSWRDSHDLGGPHAPFDLSDETNQGAPRGQVQYFKDPNSTLAKTALGRLDLTTLVEPLGLEMDQDYDCVHNSNPSCDYITYGPLCAPQTQLPGTQIYAMSYGMFDPSWLPVDCNGK